MSDVGNIIRLFGTAVVGAFVPPAGVAIAAVANVGAGIYDMSVGQPPGADGQAVKIQGLAKDLQSATAAIPGFKKAATDKKGATTDKGTGKKTTPTVNVKAPPPGMGRTKQSTDETENFPESDSSDSDSSDSDSSDSDSSTASTSGDASDALIRSLRETGDTPPDTAALIAERNPITDVVDVVETPID